MVKVIMVKVVILFVFVTPKVWLNYLKADQHFALALASRKASELTEVLRPLHPSVPVFSCHCDDIPLLPHGSVGQKSHRSHGPKI